MIVVADTTPLLTLFKIGRIDVLNKLYNSVHVPFAVFEELTRINTLKNQSILEIVRF